MSDYRKLYENELYSVLGLNSDKDDNCISKSFDPKHLDCLLHPKKYPLIWCTTPCSCSIEDQKQCLEKCAFNALYSSEGGVTIDPELCLGCGICIDKCKSEKLKASTDIIAALKAVRQSQDLTYAMIAPSFIGQFDKQITPGQLRTALRLIGFDGMVEVALFADILTLKEALEYEHHIHSKKDFQLTSCCCPVWIGMIRKQYRELLGHVSGSVSPMVACGRVIKALHPNAVTIFIGPCLAKKQEARQPDISDAVDYVLTYAEIHQVFEALDIHPNQLEDEKKQHSSKAGIIYARKGGVSEAVKSTVKVINPQKKFTTKQADGVPACKQLIQDILDGTHDACFYEGMGCPGGCVGGPRVIQNVKEGTTHVNTYGAETPYANPVENPFVIELLQRLGLTTIESLVQHPNLFDRNFE